LSERVLKGSYLDDEVTERIAIKTGKLKERIEGGRFTFVIPYYLLKKEERKWILSKVRKKNELKSTKEIIIPFQSLYESYEWLEEKGECVKRNDFETLILDSEEGAKQFIVHYKKIEEKVNKLKEKYVDSKEKEKKVTDLLCISYCISDDFLKKEIVKKNIWSRKKRHYFVRLDSFPKDFFYQFLDSSILEKHKLEIKEKELDKYIETDEEAIEYIRDWVKEQEDSRNKDTNKKSWIEAHGSPHLKRAYKKGYHCQREYIMQRCQKELPGFTVDFDEKKVFQERPFPSEKALDEEEFIQGKCDNLEVRVMWDKKEKCEVVAVTNYLGKYKLSKTI
jgi:hypothetical protein